MSVRAKFLTAVCELGALDSWFAGLSGMAYCCSAPRLFPFKLKIISVLGIHRSVLESFYWE